MKKVSITNSKRDYFVILAIIIIAFIIRVFCIKEIQTPESLLYTEKAFHFFETTYAVDDHRASRFGIIFPMALLMKMIGLNVFSIYGYGILCSLGTVLIIFYLGKRLLIQKLDYCLVYFLLLIQPVFSTLVMFLYQRIFYFIPLWLCYGFTEDWNQKSRRLQ